MTMEEITKNCLHCGSPMQGGRSTRKYCSDACKQAAFYSRAARQPLTANGNGNTLNGNDGLPDVTAVREQASQYMVKKPTVGEEIPFIVTRSIKEEPADEPVHDNMTSASKSYPFVDEEEQPLPVSVTRQHSTNHATRSTDTPGQERTQKAKHERKSFKSDEDEKEYEWIRCTLLDDVGSYCNDNYTTTEMFQYPKKYWYSSDLEKVKWVSIRFRSIIESMLWLDKVFVERKLIRQLNDALKTMIASFNFRFLPRNYPLKNEIVSLQKTLQQVLGQAARTTRFTLTRQTKIKLMAMRFQLADIAPRVRFRRLDFSK